MAKRHVSPGQGALDFDAPLPAPSDTPLSASPSVPQSLAVEPVSSVAVVEAVQASTAVQLAPQPVSLNTPKDVVDELLRLLMEDHLALKGLFGQVMPVVRQIQQGRESETDDIRIIEMVRQSVLTQRFLKWGMRTPSAKFLFEHCAYDPNFVPPDGGYPLLVVLLERKVSSAAERTALGYDIEKFLELAGEQLNLNVRIRRWSILDFARGKGILLPSH